MSISLAVKDGRYWESECVSRKVRMSAGEEAEAVGGGAGEARWVCGPRWRPMGAAADIAEQRGEGRRGVRV